MSGPFPDYLFEELGRSPMFVADPICPHAVLLDPGELHTLAFLSSAKYCLPLAWTTSAFPLKYFGAVLHGLLELAVYASQLGSPQDHARLAYGRLPVRRLQGLYESFAFLSQVMLITSHASWRNHAHL